jgi:excisionase family DNA binding protein
MTAADQVQVLEPPSEDPWDGLPLLISIPRAAALLGLSRSSTYRYASEGELPIRRLGGRIYVLTAGIRALVEHRESHGEVA